MNDVRYIEVTENELGQRLDNYLLRHLKGVPKSHIYRIIRGGEVRVNRKRAKACSRLACGDLVRIPPIRMASPADVYVGAQLEQHLLKCIIYEDDLLLVVNKPAGIAVHGGSGLSLGLIEALRKIRGDLPYLELVHRLDKETSGCILIAKKRSALRSLQALLAARTMQKTYWAVLSGAWQGPSSVTVNAALQKNTLQSGERMVVVDEMGKPSQTRFTLLKNHKDACFVEAMPKTGRTHQIRVHSASLGHPILGDQKYGTQELPGALAGEATRLYLHAKALQFELNGKEYRFEAPVDDKFTALERALCLTL